ncbi:MAG: hypothetical protein COX57_02425 [Alphaproteobacteria bacterium CG_4_10_14_0_2_um_filter_63_37]|nr:MAG: hypothetical protein AUJ55_13355 [Proteobacteria bacterium CG1_02_64_396]PJA25615.1 MAG: hypothetical protein COX57_02425 [Alphaproteobacteria bacterium CG_4_10_14_0_2_um_filter_63_37]
MGDLKTYVANRRSSDPAFDDQYDEGYRVFVQTGSIQVSQEVPVSDDGTAETGTSPVFDKAESNDSAPP